MQKIHAIERLMHELDPGAKGVLPADGGAALPPLEGEKVGEREPKADRPAASVGKVSVAIDVLVVEIDPPAKG